MSVSAGVAGHWYPGHSQNVPCVLVVLVALQSPFCWGVMALSVLMYA